MRAASPAMVSPAGSSMRSAAVAASQMHPIASTASTAVLSFASTLANPRATSAKPRVVRARKAYCRGERSVIRGSLLQSGELVHDLDHRRTHDDDEERRQNAEDQRDRHLDWHLLGLLLRPLAALHPHLGRLDAQHVGNRDTER